ncbi:MAG: glutathione peroxidase [Myxococcota bacterium]|nr:glutathione peroxidase [Myxococcota bacterium]
MFRFYLIACLMLSGCTVSQAAKEAALKETSVFEGLTLHSIDGVVLPPRLYENKVVLIVNVASQCGFTSQYGALQRLYERYKARGLLVIGVPCNQFGQQEPGTEAEIAAFAKREYGVTFPLLKKQKVKGQADPLFRRLMGTSVGRHAGVRWNFEKFLINRRGQLVNRFSSLTKPTDLDLVREIEGALTTSGG